MLNMPKFKALLSRERSQFQVLIALFKIDEFDDPQGISLDQSGKCYVVDSRNNRIVRIDDMTGKNWISFGSTGVGKGEFTSPQAIYVNSTGKIYVSDSGNGRIVLMDDITGKNWTTFGDHITAKINY